MADAVLLLVAVVAELATLPEVVIVANFVSTMAANVLISEFRMVPSRIFDVVTELSDSELPLISVSDDPFPTNEFAIKAPFIVREPP